MQLRSISWSALIIYMILLLIYYILYSFQFLICMYFMKLICVNIVAYIELINIYIYDAKYLDKDMQKLENK